MADKKKNLSAVVGIDKLYYAILEEDTEDTIEYMKEVRIPYVQNVSIEPEQEIAKAYGDNRVAEMAVSTGPTAVDLQFHTLPLEDRVAILGLEDDEGLVIQKSQVKPPYVAMALEKVKGDGSSELVGLTKGMFTLPSTEDATQEDTLEFGNDTISGEFSGRTYDDIAQIFAHVKDDDDEKREAFMKKLFSPMDGNGGGDDVEG